MGERVEGRRGVGLSEGFLGVDLGRRWTTDEVGEGVVGESGVEDRRVGRRGLRKPGRWADVPLDLRYGLHSSPTA